MYFEGWRRYIVIPDHESPPPGREDHHWFGIGVRVAADEARPRTTATVTLPLRKEVRGPRHCRLTRNRQATFTHWDAAVIDLHRYLGFMKPKLWMDAVENYQAV